MKRRVGLVTKCLIGAVFSSALVASNGALAQTATTALAAADQTMPTAAPIPFMDPTAPWWFHGTIEAGGRFFLNNPQKGDQTANGQSSGCGGTKLAPCPGVYGQSLAGYYEYSDIKPGAFSNFDIATGSKDGLYQVNLGGQNVGYNDQSYYFEWSKAGEHYFNFGWDQTPHLYSKSALTPFVVNGNNVALVNGAVGHGLSSDLATFAQPMDIGIRRDTASANYRWTPNDAWDFNADYSHMSRTGTQISAIGFGTTPGLMQVPKPVDDATQNYSVTGEYVGTSAWGQKIVYKAGYSGSQYTDNFSAFTVQTPAASGANAAGSQAGLISLWPSNQANGGSASVAADLPWQSRYVGTVNYTQMTQNAAFIPAGVNIVFNPPPQQGLNGDINTLLSNNVVTTKITSDLTSKLSYRYYDFKNNTAEMLLQNPPCNLGGGTGCSVNGTNSLALSYIKQNAGEELNWRPTKEWNFGAAYGFERYDWTKVEVTATNENSGKIFADWKPSSWLTFRSSGYYAVRRSENYNYMANVGSFQWPNNSGNMQVASSYRNLMLDNRDLWKANFSVDLVALHNLTITPTIKYQDANYGVNALNQQGLSDSKGWGTGIDAIYVVNPNTSFMVGYMFEYYTQLMYGCAGAAQEGSQVNAGQTVVCSAGSITNDKSTVHTVTTALRYAAIPDKLDTEFRYTAAHGADNMSLSVGPFGPTLGSQFPVDSTWFQRLDASATYKFDRETVAQLGWKGDIKAKLHYAWERNSANNWANNQLLPFSQIPGATSTGNLWMGWYNPNYNVHMLMASIAASW